MSGEARVSQNNSVVAAPVMGDREWAMLLALAVLWDGFKQMMR
jgi:hypothetical protein